MGAVWDAYCWHSPKEEWPRCSSKDIPPCGEEAVELSPEIAALLVLLGFAAAAVVFTLVFVVVVDRSVANTRAENEGEKDEDRESESS